MINRDDNIEITKNELSIDDCFAFVQDTSCGGITLFVGTIRDHVDGKTVTHLEFEVYEEMAKKELEKIIKRCRAKWPVKKLAVHHRYGQLAIGDIAVIIAVATPHRKAAFEACKFLIDELKEKVPIWKKEFLEDGSYWVGAQT
jgi:molybdopterin synthase catalytic subunit